MKDIKSIFVWLGNEGGRKGREGGEGGGEEGRAYDD